MRQHPATAGQLAIARAAAAVVPAPAPELGRLVPWAALEGERTRAHLRMVLQTGGAAHESKATDPELAAPAFHIEGHPRAGGAP